MDTPTFDPNQHPRERDGKFAAVERDEADGVVLTFPTTPFNLYTDIGEDASDEFVATPVYPVARVVPGTVTHVALGPGRRWARVCGETDPRTGQPCNALLLSDGPTATSGSANRHAFTEHRGTIATTLASDPDGPTFEAYDEVGLKVDEWVNDERHGFRLRFTNLDEGWEGDFDPDDPSDDNLLRLDVEVRPEHPDADLNDVFVDDQTGEWSYPSGGSWCTRIRADHVTPQQLRRLARDVTAELASRTRDGSSISPSIESFSMLSEADAPTYTTDDPTPHQAGTSER